jgi:hypothetical protein
MNFASNLPMKLTIHKTWPLPLRCLSYHDDYWLNQLPYKPLLYQLLSHISLQY